jgi:Luciferase-like monooxygenase
VTSSNARARPLEVGLFVPNWSGSVNGQPPRWREIAALARRAEDAGFDSLWVADTILVRPDTDDPMGYWECWSVLAALATVTSRVALGSLVTGAGFRNPVLLANLVNTADEISDGRVILGIGAGETGQYTHLGMDPGHAMGAWKRRSRSSVLCFATGTPRLWASITKCRTRSCRCVVRGRQVLRSWSAPIPRPVLACGGWQRGTPTDGTAGSRSIAAPRKPSGRL